MLVFHNDSDTFASGYVDVSLSSYTPTPDLMKSLEDRMTEEVGGTIVSSAPLKLNGVYPGRELAFSIASGGRIDARTYIVDRRYYIALVQRTKQSRNSDEDVNRFLDSFALLPTWPQRVSDAGHRGWRAVEYGARALLTALGFYLLYLSIFTYDTERGRFQNKLEDFWIRVDERARGSGTKNLRFLTESVLMTRRGFDRLLGAPLISLRMMTVCAAYSIASSVIYFRHLGYPLSLADTVFVVACATSLAFVRSPRSVRVLVCLTLLGVVAPLIASAVFPSFYYREQTGVDYWRLLVGVVFDVSFVAVNRRLLIWAEGRGSTSIVLALLLNICFAGLLVGPVLMVEIVRSYPSIFSSTFRLISTFPRYLVNDITGIGTTNFFAAVVAIAAFLVGMIALAHRLFWPMISRLTYAFAETGLMKNRGRLCAVGIALISLSWLGIADSLSKIKSLFM